MYTLQFPDVLEQYTANAEICFSICMKNWKTQFQIFHDISYKNQNEGPLQIFTCLTAFIGQSENGLECLFWPSNHTAANHLEIRFFSQSSMYSDKVTRCKFQCFCNPQVFVIFGPTCPPSCPRPSACMGDFYGIGWLWIFGLYTLNFTRFLQECWHDHPSPLTTHEKKEKRSCQSVSNFPNRSTNKKTKWNPDPWSVLPESYPKSSVFWPSGNLVRLNFVETCRLTSLIDLPNFAIALQTKRKSNK